MISFRPVLFYVREIPVYGDLILSPMDGFSDLPFRLICRELGSAMSYTEFVNVDELQGRKPNRIAVAKTLEDNGASLIAVHGRTKAQAYKGNADWDAIAEVKQAVRVPVIGNGDVRTVADIARIKAHTHCDGVMIGRGAIGNPWLFARKDREQVTIAEKVALMRRHFQLTLDFYGESLGLILFRK